MASPSPRTWPNWIGAEECLSQAGLEDVRAATEPFEELGRWPRSDASDLLAARQAANTVVADWGRVGREERRRVVDAAWRALAEDADGLHLVGRAVGFTPAELGRTLVTGAPIGERPDASGVTLVAPDASEVLARAFERIASELVRGRCVVHAADARLLPVGAVLRAAFDQADLPRGVLSTVHAVDTRQLAHALEAQPAGWQAVSASGSLARIAALRASALATAPREERLQVLRMRAMEIDAGLEDDELEVQARRVAREAFGRVATLSGQAHDMVGRVYCAEAVFSSFTEALLSVLDEPGGERWPPLPALDRDATAGAHAACVAGLDEGATLIFGDPGDGTRPVWHPAVFTNVLPEMACARRIEPLPLLALLRVREGPGMGG